MLPVMAASCHKSCDRNAQTPTRGAVTVLVDETILPMIDGQARVFESDYRSAKLNLAGYPEEQLSALMQSDTSGMAVLARPLTVQEERWYESQKIEPQITEVAYDGIALITNIESRDTLITTETLRGILRGEQAGLPLVFDNQGSSTVRYMKAFAGVDSLAGAYSLSSNRDVIEYVAANPNTIGFAGVNWLYEADAELQPSVAKVRLVAVGEDTAGYYKPTQNDIAESKYAFTRKIYFVNTQGSYGLGLGFAAFVAGDAGQRIALKAGVVPITYPKREIIIRKEL
jgi:phosphate transport system substrate-binding protein